MKIIIIHAAQKVIQELFSSSDFVFKENGHLQVTNGDSWPYLCVPTEGAAFKDAIQSMGMAGLNFYFEGNDIVFYDSEPIVRLENRIDGACHVALVDDITDRFAKKSIPIPEAQKLASDEIDEWHIFWEEIFPIVDKASLTPRTKGISPKAQDCIKGRFDAESASDLIERLKNFDMEGRHVEA